MSEKYTNLIQKSHKRKRQSRLIIKNGIQYWIIITTDQKPKFKKPKFINTKKWLIKNVLLTSFKITDKAIIKEIIDANSKEQESYDKCFQMDVDRLYTLMLSQKQYESLTRFLDKSEVNIGDKISFIRKGIGFKTRIIFYTPLNKNEK